MRSLLLALVAAVAGGIAGAQLAPAASHDPCPAVERNSYAMCMEMVPHNLPAAEHSDWMQYCVDGGTAPDGSGSTDTAR